MNNKGVEKNLAKLLKKGKALFLAYDQGLEHGPIDFNDKNVNPLYIIDIAKSGGYNALIFHKGIAEKYSQEIKKSKVPLIIKLNGKTCLVKGEPVSKKVFLGTRVLRRSPRDRRGRGGQEQCGVEPGPPEAPAAGACVVGRGSRPQSPHAVGRDRRAGLGGARDARRGEIADRRCTRRASEEGPRANGA